MRVALRAVRWGNAPHCRSMLWRAKHSFRDITGGAITASSESVVDLVDQAITEVLREATDAPKTIEKVLSKDPTCAVALTMKGLHSSLLFGPTLPKREMRQILAILEGSAAEGLLNKRELLMAAALFQSVQGDFATAANLLETVMLDHPDDVASLKYTQQAFYLLGDTHNMFGAMARHYRFFDDSHMLHGHGLGLMALGAAHDGRTEMAEEFAERSLKLTMKQDPAAKVALGHVMLVNGRTSEGLSHLKQLADTWAKTDGFWELTHMQGLLNCQTGRYRAGELALEEMMDRLEELPGPHPRALCFATSLLWTLHMDSQISRTEDAVNTGRYFEQLAKFWAPLMNTEMHSLVFAHMLMCMTGHAGLQAVQIEDVSTSMLVHQSPSEATEMSKAYETLAKVLPELKFAHFPAAQHARHLSGLQQAILHILGGRSSEAADALLPIQHSLHHVGGSSVEHWVWRGMLGDGLLLSKRHAEARLLFSEWLARIPTQAQYWSRFAHALKGCGLTTAGEHASFTANQLGIGQHGHGAH